MVKTLNSRLKGTGFESYPDHLCFFLEQENLLQLFHPTQVSMGTWLVAFSVQNKIVKLPNRRMWLPMCYVFAIVCKRLDHGYAVDKRYITALLFLNNSKIVCN